MKFIAQNDIESEVIRVTTKSVDNGVEVCLNGVGVLRFENNNDGSLSVLNMRQYSSFHSECISKLKSMRVPLELDGTDIFKIKIR